MTLFIYDKFITKTSSGETVPAAVVTIYKEGGSLASLYLDSAGTTPAGNPVTASPSGRVQVYMEAGTYTVSAMSGGSIINYPDVLIGVDGSNTQLDINGNITDVEAYLNSIRNRESLSDAVSMSDSEFQLLNETNQTVTTSHNKTSVNGGGCEYVVKTLAQASSDGDVIDGDGVTGGNHPAGTGYALIRKYKKHLDVAQWGLPAGSAELNASVLNDITNFAYDNSIRNIIVNVDATIDPSAYIPNKANVWYVGNGSLTGLYRVRVQNPGQAVTKTNYKNIKPHQLSVFNATKNPVVVSMGDSISTGGEGAQGPNTVGFGATMWNVLISEVQSQNRNKNITFYNRGIGGQTWLNANDNVRPATNVVPWYTENKAWLDYVEELEPDLLFLAFGMNDSNGFNAGAMVAAVNKIKAWSKVPDLVFITTPVPALSTDLGNDGFGFVGETFQEGRDGVASYTRGFSEFYDYPYIDVNRYICMARDGFDPCTSDYKREATGSLGNGSGAYTSTTGSRDFVITAYCTGLTAGEIEDEFNGVNGALACRVGFNPNDIIFLQNSGNDTILVNQFSGGVNSYSNIDTGISFPTTDFSITISVSNTTLVILLDDTKIYQNSIIRTAALFPVQMGHQGYLTGPYSSFDFSSGKGVSTGKTATDLQIWGVSSETAETKYPYGGNGVNHYASAGIELIVRPAVSNERFYGDRVQDCVASPYPLTQNEHLSNWASGELDNWTRTTGSLLTETSGGVHSAPNCAQFGTYPCGISQDVSSRLSRDDNYVLVMIGKDATSYGTNSGGYVSPHSTRVVIEYNDGSPQTITITPNQLVFGSEWSCIEIDLAKEYGGELPPVSQITSMTVSIYLTGNGYLAYAGVHEQDAVIRSFFNPLI